MGGWGAKFLFMVGEGRCEDDTDGKLLRTSVARFA